ncbi:tetratricopeptide repeat protein [Actinoplanes sp. NPDC023936]|uniref:ATP-binding protein n=1 Tax=Actinoplanes sp. NPDC023936 TaxID=3154910 RepID=UPI0033FA013D
MRKRSIFTLAALPIVLFLLLPVAGNIAATRVPAWLEPYLWLSWPLTLLLAVPAVVSEVRNQRIRHMIDRLSGSDGSGSRTADVPIPRNLPRDIPDFTGRQDRVDAIVEHLGASADASTVTIATIHGMPGVGKTTLAVHAAHRAENLFPDGQLFVDLRGFAAGVAAAEPMSALENLLQQLGVPVATMPATLDERVAAYRTRVAGRRLLIVLDNARSENQIRPLLPGSPGAAVIITSRVHLGGIEGAMQVPLDVMPEAEACDLLTKIVGRDRVADQRGDVTEIASLCGHLPLAIRLTGARMVSRPRWSAAGLAERLRSVRQRLEHFRSGDMSVVAAFALSYENLRPEVQQVFRAMGLGPGGNLGAPAIAALAGMPVADAEAILEELIDVHLVEEPSDGHYGMHDLLRQHARDVAVRIDRPGDLRAAQIRLLTHYLARAAPASAILDPTCRPITMPGNLTADVPPCGSYDEALKWFEVERRNLVAAVKLADELKADEFVWRLTMALHPYFLLRGYTDDWVATGELAIQAARRLGNVTAEADVRQSLGVACRRLGRPTEAVEHHEQALSGYQRGNDKSGEMSALTQLGIAYRRLGRYSAALDVQRKAVALHDELRDPSGEAATLTNLGLVYQRLGRYDDSLRCHERARTIAGNIPERHCEAMANTNIGIVYERTNRLEDALNSHQAALTIAKEIGDRHVEGHTMNNIGIVLRRIGRHDEALDYHHRGLELLRKTGSRGDECEALTDIGHAYREVGQDGAALESFDIAYDVARHIGDRYLEARALQGRARTVRHRDRATADRDHRAAVAIFSELQVPEAEEPLDPDPDPAPRH